MTDPGKIRNIALVGHRGTGKTALFEALLSRGGGVKVFFNEHVGLRFEGRGFFTVIDDYDSGCYDDCCGCYDYYEDGETLSQGQASAGLIFAW